jgi:hypothetical protein
VLIVLESAERFRIVPVAAEEAFGKRSNKHRLDH